MPALPSAGQVSTSMARGAINRPNKAIDGMVWTMLSSGNNHRPSAALLQAAQPSGKPTPKVKAMVSSTI